MTNSIMPGSPEISRNFIDVEQLFARKNPRLLKVLPGFIFRWLKKIIRLEEINHYIYHYRDKTGLDYIEALLNDFGVKCEIQLAGEGNDWRGKLENLLTPTGRYIIAANHPLGGLDGLVLMRTIGKIRPDIVFPVNDLLTYLPGLKPLFIPINKHGKNTENLEIIENTFASDKVILFFPAGLVSRKQKGGVIKDLEWKKTFITKARKHRRDVVPVYIDGKNSSFFYNLARWRRRLGIKANIEMLFLPRELFNQKGKTIRMTFGQPIPWTTFDRSRTDAGWAEFVREKVYNLGAF